jgi:hypothetical protein
MLRKVFSVMVLAVAILFATSEKANAQKGTSYKNAMGMRLEFGSNYGTLVGVSGKHFFDEHSAGEFQALFGKRLTMLGAEYQYHGDIQNAAGLRWIAGAGAGVAFTKKSSYYDYYWGHTYASGGATDFFLRPVMGMDYKVKDVPLNLTFDWRPVFSVTHGTDFEAARFGVGLRFALN